MSEVKHTPTFACDLDGKVLSWQPEREGQPASIGMICAWGGFTIAEISNEVPEGERDEYADKLATRYNQYDRLVEALRLAMDFIDKHPADPDISVEQTEAWVKLENFDARALLAELEGKA